MSGKDDVKIWQQFFIMNNIIKTENIKIYGGRDGRGGIEKLIDNGKLIKRTSIPFMMIEDSDNKKKDKDDKFQSEGFSVDEFHTLSEKEIENYLINPIAISKFTGKDIDIVENIIITSKGNGKEKLNNIFKNLGLTKPDSQIKAELVCHLPKIPEEILQIINKVKEKIKNEIS